MLYYLIMCRSLTYAQRAARALERSGIMATVTKAPQGVSTAGCAYCVRVSGKRVKEAIEVLRHAELDPGRVFLQESDGTYREVDV